ncbi:MAG: hypothetical protein M5U18_14575 [Dehalococcoidia bacterium]|nr:hypothetical protein [Dehalococcoidia bacterium]
MQFSEAEVTSRGVAYVEERDVPIKDLQIYFCPDGTAEAKGKVNVLGRDVSVLARGTLDVSGGQNRIVVDELKAGNLPPGSAQPSSTRSSIATTFATSRWGSRSPRASPPTACTR